MPKSGVAGFASPEAPCFITVLQHLVPAALGSWIREIALIIRRVIFLSKQQRTLGRVVLT